jgi:hypothetical protein
MEQACETHSLAPYNIAAAWLLQDWNPPTVELGEHCLYRAFGIRFCRHSGDLKDDSNFVIPVDFDLKPLIDEVENDLRGIEHLIG